MKDNKPQIQEAERNPDRINAIGKKQKTKNVRHTIVKLLLKKILKATREKENIIYRETQIKNGSRYSASQKIMEWYL